LIYADLYYQVDGLRDLGFNGFEIKDFGGPGLSIMDTSAIIYEIGKVDSSVGTFIMVHNAIGMNVVNMLGSEE
jgi:alkylation response protein AidB-like acyl-CoA dehydrogenase